MTADLPISLVGLGMEYCNAAYEACGMEV